MPKSTRTVDVSNSGTTTQVPLIVDKNAQNEEAIGRAIVYNGDLLSPTNRLPVDGSGVTQPVSLTSLPPLPTGSNTIGAVTISNFPVTQPISATLLPLPAGAATAAKQPAIGVAGTPSVDVISVQGVVNGTPQPISGSVSVSNFPVNQPVSATTLPLPTGAATAAKQPAIGVPGTPSVDVMTVQGISNGIAIRTRTFTESIAELFQKADDRIVTTNYQDTTKQVITNVVITSASTTALTGSNQLTITFTNPTTTSERVAYVLS